MQQQQLKTVDGWTLTRDHGDSVYYENDVDGATVSVEPYTNPVSEAEYVVKTDYIGVNCTRGRLKACHSFSEALDVAAEHMAEYAHTGAEK